MRIRTLVILALLFFLVGGILGGGYAFFYHIGGDVKGPVASVLPTVKSPEDKMIDEFIEEQEQKQDDNMADDAKDTDNEKDSSDDKKQDDDVSANSANEDKETPEDNKKPAEATGNIGKPTVSDGTTLRVRTEPSTDSEVLVGIPNTEEVVINSSKNGWYNITTSNGTKGWVSSDYIEIVQ